MKIRGSIGRAGERYEVDLEVELGVDEKREALEALFAAGAVGDPDVSTTEALAIGRRMAKYILEKQQ